MARAVPVMDEGETVPRWFGTTVDIDDNHRLSEARDLLAKDGAHYAIRNPELLEGAEILVKSGVDIDVLLDRWVRVQEDLEDVATSFVSIITVVDRRSKRVVAGPDIHARGVAEVAGERVCRHDPRAHLVGDKDDGALKCGQTGGQISRFPAPVRTRQHEVRKP